MTTYEEADVTLDALVDNLAMRRRLAREHLAGGICMDVHWSAYLRDQERFPVALNDVLRFYGGAELSAERSAPMNGKEVDSEEQSSQQLAETARARIHAAIEDTSP